MMEILEVAAFLIVAGGAAAFAVAVLAGLLTRDLKEEEEDFIVTKDREKIKFNEDDQE